MPRRVRLPVLQDVQTVHEPQLRTPTKGKRHRVTSLTRAKQEVGIPALLYPEAVEWRPKTRADCADVPRPCPYVGCRHHLYLEPAGESIYFLFDGEPGEMAESCTLDIVDRTDGMTLEEVGVVIGLTRERIRQIILRISRQRWKLSSLIDFWGD